MTNRKLFLARFTFRCGEAELPFEHTLFARSVAEVRNKVDNYLRHFAAEARRVDDFSYEYYGGYYAVSYSGADPATPEAVVRQMLMPI